MVHLRSHQVNAGSSVEYSSRNPRPRAAELQDSEGTLLKSHRVIANYVGDCILTCLNMENFNADMSFFSPQRVSTGVLRTYRTVTDPGLKDAVGSLPSPLGVNSSGSVEYSSNSSSLKSCRTWNVALPSPTP